MPSLGEVYSKRQSLQLGHPDYALPASCLSIPTCLTLSSRFLSLTLLVVDADHHGEGGAEGDDARHGVCPGSLAVLYLHPAVNIVS